jgi:hypothetical protein
MFEPGQTVECIDAEPHMGIPTGLVERRLYVVVLVAPRPGCITPGVVVEGAPAPWGDGLHAASRFRPLPDSRLDAFRTALEPMKEEA